MLIRIISIVSSPCKYLQQVQMHKDKSAWYYWHSGAADEIFSNAQGKPAHLVLDSITMCKVNTSLSSIFSFVNRLKTYVTTENTRTYISLYISQYNLTNNIQK